MAQFRDIGDKERVGILNDFLSPLKSLSYFRNADGCTDVTALLFETLEAQKKALDSDNFAQLKKAVVSDYQSEDTWGNESVWNDMIEYYRARHAQSGLIMSEHSTNHIERKKYYTNNLFKDTDGLLWLNLGAVNKNLFRSDLEGKAIAAAFRDEAAKKAPLVILTFGWPELCKDNNFDHEGVMSCIRDVPLFNEVIKYGEKTGRVLLVALPDRMENHFGLSTKKLISGNVNLEMGFEVKHNEEQVNRWMLHPVESGSVLLEMALVVKHILNKPGCQWLSADTKNARG